MPNSKRKSKARRRRGVAKQTQPRINMEPVSTLESVMRNLTLKRVQPRRVRPMRSTSLQNYISCATSPFHGGGGSGIPDSLSAPKIVVDHSDTGTITIGSSGTAHLKFMPTLPVIVAGRPIGAAGADVTFQANGVTLSSTVFPGSYSVGLMPVVTANDWKAWMSAITDPQAETTPPYSAMKYRVVSVGLRMWYTGAASTAAGSIAVTTSRVQFKEDEVQPRVVITGVPPTGTAAVTYTADAVVTNLPVSANVFNQETHLARIDMPVEIVLRRQMGTLKWHEMRQIPQYGVDKVGNVWWNHYTSDNASWGGNNPMQVCDDDFSCAIIEITGAPPGASFRLQTAFCIEYQPLADSQFSKLARVVTDGVPSSYIETINKSIYQAHPSVSNQVGGTGQSSGAKATTNPPATTGGGSNRSRRRR